MKQPQKNLVTNGRRPTQAKITNQKSSAEAGLDMGSEGCPNEASISVPDATGYACVESKRAELTLVKK